MVSKFETLISIAASVLLLFACLLTLGDVIGRNALNRPISGATELTELALVGITFLLYPRLAYRHQHIAIDLLDFMMGPMMRRFQQILSGVLGAVLFFAIGYRLWFLAERAANFGDMTAYLRVPMGPVLTFMSVLSIITAVGFAITVVLAIFGPSHMFAHPPGGKVGEPAREIK